MDLQMVAEIEEYATPMVFLVQSVFSYYRIIVNVYISVCYIVVQMSFLVSLRSRRISSILFRRPFTLMWPQWIPRFPELNFFTKFLYAVGVMIHLLFLFTIRDTRAPFSEVTCFMQARLLSFVEVSLWSVTYWIKVWIYFYLFLYSCVSTLSWVVKSVIMS